MINYTTEELRHILINEDLKEAEKEYQRLTKVTNDRHERYRNHGIGYILDTEKSMNWSDRSKLMNPVIHTYNKNPLVAISQLKLRLGAFFLFYLLMVL